MKWIATLLTTLVFFFSSTAFAQSKVAVIDMRKAVTETEDGLRAAATIKKVFQSRQLELDNKQKDLAKQRDDLAKLEKTLSKEEFQKKAENWQKQGMALQQVFVEYNKELEKKERELTEPIHAKMLGILRKIATAEGYDAILDKVAVPYIKDTLDVTSRCVTEYNKGAK